MIFDSHAHYDDNAFNEDRNELLSSFKENGVGFVMNIASSLESVKTTIDLTEKYDFVYGAVGIHPSDTQPLNEENFEWLEEMAKNEKVKAIGEIGLDYHYPEPSKEWQKEWFIRQLHLAKKLSLPVVIHSRDAAKDTLDIIKSEGKNLEGVIHCFSYGKEMAAEYLKLGYYFGIGGVITFKNGKKLREVVEMLPMDKILVETDCPYLSPEPNRGKRNSSLNIPYIIKQIAEIKQLSEQEVINITEKNAKELYKVG